MLSNDNQIHPIGTYRTPHYSVGKEPQYLSAHQQRNKEQVWCISAQYQCAAINPIQLRIQDYYNIKTGNLARTHQYTLQNAISNNRFEPSLLNSQSITQPSTVNLSTFDANMRYNSLHYQKMAKKNVQLALSTNVAQRTHRELSSLFNQGQFNNNNLNMNQEPNKANPFAMNPSNTQANSKLNLFGKPVQVAPKVVSFSNTPSVPYVGAIQPFTNTSVTDRPGLFSKISSVQNPIRPQVTLTPIALPNIPASSNASNPFAHTRREGNNTPISSMVANSKNPFLAQSNQNQTLFNPSGNMSQGSNTANQQGLFPSKPANPFKVGSQSNQANPFPPSQSINPFSATSNISVTSNTNATSQNSNPFKNCQTPVQQNQPNSNPFKQSTVINPSHSQNPNPFANPFTQNSHANSNSNSNPNPFSKPLNPSNTQNTNPFSNNASNANNSFRQSTITQNPFNNNTVNNSNPFKPATNSNTNPFAAPNSQTNTSNSINIFTKSSNQMNQPNNTNPFSQPALSTQNPFSVNQTPNLLNTSLVTVRQIRNPFQKIECKIHDRQSVFKNVIDLYNSQDYSKNVNLFGNNLESDISTEDVASEGNLKESSGPALKVSGGTSSVKDTSSGLESIINNTHIFGGAKSNTTSPSPNNTTNNNSSNTNLFNNTTSSSVNLFSKPTSSIPNLFANPTTTANPFASTNTNTNKNLFNQQPNIDDRNPFKNIERSMSALSSSNGSILSNNPNSLFNKTTFNTLFNQTGQIGAVPNSQSSNNLFKYSVDLNNVGTQNDSYESQRSSQGSRVQSLSPQQYSAFLKSSFQTSQKFYFSPSIQPEIFEESQYKLYRANRNKTSNLRPQRLFNSKPQHYRGSTESQRQILDQVASINFQKTPEQLQAEQEREEQLSIKRYVQYQPTKLPQFRSEKSSRRTLKVFQQIRYINGDYKRRVVIIKTYETSQSILTSDRIKDLIREQIEDQGIMKPSPQIMIKQIVRDDEIIVECSVKQRLINLDRGYGYSYTRLQNDVLVTGLCIFNDFGEVYFPQTINLSKIDFRNIIQIGESHISLYQDRKYPDINTGLNRDFVGKLYKCQIAEKMEGKGDFDIDYIESKLERRCRRRGVKFIDFDPLTYHWRFKVFGQE